MNYEEQLTQLKEGKIASLFIPKEEFMAFRLVLLAREDMKHFRGVAEQGGTVTYYYENDPRS
ncbi:hypothetical protein [Paenisporosarcina cavernae]|uniref:Uncharacterized protein n=1 Tax=Paenisporosarcina cavernae TaxID=2320858 RepID=A0A385YRE8_9BACL|nr:hypothetical protein [Paenisporosarcina cavernae]AYC29064.1 hypothetical protein D3873_03925 [Paenisporosarcina cavernae]